MWQREDIGQQTFLNTQDTVYEVLSKTPEHILCKGQDAVKIDLLLKKSQLADPHPVYGVKLVPYKNMASGVVTDPNAGGNFSQNVALAIAFIAADRDDWQRFIPTGLKTRELSLTKKRQEEAIEKQNQPFKTRTKKADGEEEMEEEFDVVNRDEDLIGSESESGEIENEKEEEEDDKGPSDGLLRYDHVKKDWVPATDDEQKDFGFDQNNAVEKEGEPFTKKKPSLAQKSALPDPEEEAAASKQLHDRVAKVLREQEQRAIEEANMLPSDRKRRQAATLNDPALEPNASEIAQHYHGADADFNVEEEREKTRERLYGSKSDSNKNGVGLMERFAPEKPETISMEPITHEKGKAPQYSLQQLMEFGSKTKLPPSIQKTLEQKNVTAAPSTVPQALLASNIQTNNQRPQDKIAQISAKFRQIRRKELELSALMIDLEELFQ